MAALKRTATRIFLVSVVLLVGAVVAGPRMLSAGYHLIYGNVFSTTDLHAPVPPAFYVSKPRDRQGHLIMTFLSSSIGLPFRPRPSATISFHELPQGRIFDSERDTKLIDATIAMAAEEGYELGAISQPTIASRSGYCLHFASAKQSEVLRRCFIEGSQISIYFRGDRKYLSDFEYVMRGMVIEASADK